MNIKPAYLMGKGRGKGTLAPLVDCRTRIPGRPTPP